MSRNVYTKRLIKGAHLNAIDNERVFKREGTRISLWTPQELIRLYPDYKIIKDKYLAFAGTDALIHIENYMYFLERQLNGASPTIMINPLHVETNGSNLICIKFDNGSLNDHRVHYIYEWMIKLVNSRSRIVTHYELQEDIPHLPKVEFSTKDLTPMSFKKIREGLVWT